MSYGTKTLIMFVLLMAGLIVNGVLGTTLGCLTLIPAGGLLGEMAGRLDSIDKRRWERMP